MNLLRILLIALAGAVPERADPTPADPGPCATLRAERRVSYERREPKLFRRVVELIESGAAPLPPPETIVQVFSSCADVLRARGESDLLAGFRFEAAADGSSVTALRGDDERRSFASRDDVGTLADRLVRYVERSTVASRRDEIRNRLWFLWIESLLKATGERHNRYDYADELADERAEDRGLSFGVGFDVATSDGRMQISRVDDPRLAGAGLAEGDELVGIDDRDPGSLSVPELRRYWTSPGPFRYVISVARKSGSLRIEGEAVSRRHRTLAWSARGRTGYVRIREFNQGSLVELRRSLRALEGEGVDRLVLDVRGNPGGALSPGLVDVFFKPGQTVLSCREHGTDEAVDTDASVEYRGIPAALLVDRGSASMAEILAAAFRAHGRGPIVGERTFGKSVGQTLYDVGDEGRLHLVTRTCYYPGTRESWDGRGIEPDVEVAIDEETRQRLAPFLDREPLRIDQQWTLDPVWQAAERRLEEAP